MAGHLELLLGPFCGAIAVLSVTRCRCCHCRHALCHVFFKSENKRKIHILEHCPLSDQCWVKRHQILTSALCKSITYLT